MSLDSQSPLCVASADAVVRRRAAEILATQGHAVIQVTTLAELSEAAGARVRTALVDLRMADLGVVPMTTLRADPRLHSTRILALGDTEIRALLGKSPGLDGGGGTRAGRRAAGTDPALISLLLRVELQVAADRQVELLSDVSRRLTALPELPPTMEALLDVVAVHVPSDTSTLFMLDERQNLVPRSARGYEFDELVLRAVPIGEGVVGWVAANRSPTIVGDSDVDARFATAGSRGSRSMLAAPVMVGERVIGALTLVRRAPAEQFTDADLTLLATIGNSAGIVLEKARLFERERAVTERLLEVERTLGLEQEMLRKLETYDRLYTQVVATVSHELKTPLMGIRGFAKLIADGETDAAEARDFGREIHENAVRLSRYVEEILEEDAVHSGRVGLRVEAVDVRALSEDVVHSLRRAAGDSHTVIAAVPPGLPAAAGDIDRLRQVLVNLVANAIKYSPQGGRIEVSARVDDGRLVLVVDDEGMGIMPSERERVFDRFYRVSSDLTRGIGGTGLGLSIVRGIVELHGGRIWVEDGGSGRGSRFCVSLPISRPVLAAADIRRKAARRPARQRLQRIALSHSIPEVTR